MAQLFNFKTNQLEDVPDESVGQAITSGTYGLRKGEALPLVAPDGTRGTVAPEEAAKALKAGFTYETAAQRLEADKQAEFGSDGAAVRAGLEGVARGATFGLSDLVATKVLGADGEGMKERKERNPVASMGGEIASAALLNPLGSLGIGAKVAGSLGKAADVTAKVAGAAPKALSAFTSAVERGLTKTLGESTIAKATSKAVSVALEAEAYNVAKNLSEASLGDVDITTERLLANSGEALKLGAGLGFAIPIAGKLATSAATRARTAAQDAGTFLREDVFKSAAKAYAGVAAKVGSAATSTTEVEIKQFLANAGTQEGLAMRQELLKGVTPEERDRLAKDLYTKLKSTVDEVNTATKTAFKEARPREIDTLLEGANSEIAQKKSYDVLTSTRAMVDEMRADPAIYSQSGTIRKMDLLTQRLERDLGENAYSAQELFARMDDFKSEIDKQVGKYGKVIAPEAIDTVERVRGIRGAVKSLLEDPESWGDAAMRQKAFNEAFSAHKTAEKELMRRFGERVTTKSGGVRSELSSVKLNTYLNQIGAARGEIRDSALTNYLDSAEALATQIEQSAANANVKFTDEGIKSLVEKTVSARADTMAKLETMSKLRALDNGAAFVSAMQQVGGIGILGASAIAPGAGAAVAGITATIKNMASAHSAVSVLAAAESMVLQTSKRVTSAVDGFMTHAARSTSKLPGRALVAPLAIRALGGKTIGERTAKNDENRQQRFRRQMDAISEIAANPAGAAEKLDAGFEKMGDYAPKVRSSLVQKQLEAATYLFNRMPQNPNAGATLNPALDAWEPSDSEIGTFERYVDAVQDPLGVIDDMRHGMITSESVEVLRDLYPSLYKQVREEFAAKSSQMQTKLPYRERLSLGILLEIPTDPTLDTQFIGLMQSLHGQAIQTNKPSHSSSGGSDKTSKAMMTQAQRVSAR